MGQCPAFPKTVINPKRQKMGSIRGGQKLLEPNEQTTGISSFYGNGRICLALAANILLLFYLYIYIYVFLCVLSKLINNSPSTTVLPRWTEPNCAKAPGPRPRSPARIAAPRSSSAASGADEGPSAFGENLAREDAARIDRRMSQQNPHVAYIVHPCPVKRSWCPPISDVCFCLL